MAEQRQALEAQQKAAQQSRQKEFELFQRHQKEWDAYQENLRQYNEWANKQAIAIANQRHAEANRAAEEQRLRWQKNQALLSKRLAAQDAKERAKWLENQQKLQEESAMQAERARQAQIRAQQQQENVNKAMQHSARDQEVDQDSWFSALFQPRRGNGSVEVKKAKELSDPRIQYLQQIAMHYSQQKYDQNRELLGRKDFFKSSSHCYMHVKFILEAFDSNKCWNKSIIGGEKKDWGKGQGKAKDAGIDLRKLGYGQILNPAAKTDQQKIQLAPEGSIIVYQDCDPEASDPGHIEIKVRENYYASDFISGGPQACTGVSVWRKIGCP